MTDRGELLDVYCGQGGACAGYQQAGFRVTGVDKQATTGYPGTLVVADALEYLDNLEEPGRWAAIHASPPCQHYSRAVMPGAQARRPDLYRPTYDRLVRLGRPWIIENVDGSPVPTHDTLDGTYSLQLCGCMFNLGVTINGQPFALYRLRWFQTSFPIPQPRHRPHVLPAFPVIGHDLPSRWLKEFPGTTAAQRAAARAEAMGITWMTNRDALSEAIPPAFTDYIGGYL